MYKITMKSPGLQNQPSPSVANVYFVRLCVESGLKHCNHHWEPDSVWPPLVQLTWPKWSLTVSTATWLHPCQHWGAKLRQDYEVIIDWWGVTLKAFMATVFFFKRKHAFHELCGNPVPLSFCLLRSYVSALSPISKLYVHVQNQR